MAYSHEHEIRPIIQDFLSSRNWTVHGGRSGVDVHAERTLDAKSFTILIEAKGDVGDAVKAPSGQRLKYVQHALGQLLLRTGVGIYGYGPGTIFGVAFPTRCWDGSDFFVATLRRRIAPELRELLRLCFFFVDETGTVIVDTPVAVDKRLFEPQS